MSETVNTARIKSLTILIPGLNGSGLELGQLPRFLENNGLEVLVPEIEGYLYGSPPGTFDSWLSQMNSLIDSHLEKYDSIHLAGISMGATLALALASQRSDISNLILMSPVLKYDGWSVPWYRSLLDLFYQLGVRNWKYAEREPYGVKNADLRRRISEKFKTSEVSEVGAASITARHLHAAKGLMGFADANLHIITNRLLLIQSVEDDTCSVWSAKEILRRTSTELRRVIWLGNSYHIVTIDNEREIVLNEVLRFLERTDAANQSMNANYSDRNLKKLKARDVEE